MSGLTQIAQDDFGAGTLLGTAPDSQPGVGLQEALNGLINDDGDVVKRGGSYHATALGNTDPLTWTWTGFIDGIEQRFASTAAKVYGFDGVLLSSPDAPGLARTGLIAVVGQYLYLPNRYRLNPYAAPGAVVEPWIPPASLPAGEIHLASIAGRLVVAAGNRVAFSDALAPGVTEPVFGDTNYHGFPGGVLVKGLFAISDTLLVFTNFGLWAISNMSFDLTDDAGNVQQTLSVLAPELSLLHEAGLAGYQSHVIAPCIDRVYLIDGVSAPVPISDSIGPLWGDLVGAGLTPGGARVFRNTLFLPMLDAAGVAQRLLACRLTRPVRGRLVYYPWTEVAGFPAGIRHFDVSLVDLSPHLLGAASDGQVADLTPFFDPNEFTVADADSTVPAFNVETRDFPTGQGQPNHVKRVRLRYSLDGAATIDAYFLPKGQGVADEAWQWLGTHTLQPGHGNLASWWLKVPKRTRWARLRFEASTGAGIPNLVIHRVEMSVRSATHGR